MIMSTRVNNTKVIISARASYLHAFEPDSINGSDPKYSVSLIIDKKDTDLIAKIKKAVEQAKEDGKSKWGGKIPANLKLFFLKAQIFHFESRLICNSKIIQIRLILVLCGQAGISQISFFIVPFFQSTIIEHLQIILDDKRNDIIFQAFLKHN